MEELIGKLQDSRIFCIMDNSLLQVFINLNCIIEYLEFLPNYPVFSLCAVKMEVVTAAIVASARFILLTRFASLLFKQRTKDEPTYQCCSHHLYSIFISAAHTALSFIKKAKRIYLHSEIWHFYALVCCILQNGNNILPNAFPRPSFVARPRGMNKISYMKYEFIRREIFVCV